MKMAEIQNYYYSGQGSLLIATRDPSTGKPGAFTRVGNVSELKLDIAITKKDHKESESGQRLLDLSLVIDRTATFSMKVQNLMLDNLALGFYGSAAVIAGGTATAEEVTLFDDSRNILANVNVTTMTTLTSKAAVGITSWVATTSTIVGAIKKPTVANNHFYKATSITTGTTGATEPVFPTNGGTVVDSGVTWKDMGKILLASPADYTLLAQQGVVKTVAGSVTDGEVYLATYTYGSYGNMDAFTQSAPPERYLRFEGLNTADGTSMIVLDIFRGQFDPLTGYSLISDDVAEIDMKGNVMQDAFRTAGNQFFSQRNIS